MMSMQGSWLRFPIQPDQRGTLATISDRSEMIKQSIISIIETRQGERVMLPDYGLPDFVFEVVDAGFSVRLAYFIKRQVERYEPLVEKIRVSIGSLDNDRFLPGFTENQQRAAVNIEYTERGSNTPRNLVVPTWEILKGASLT